MLRSSRIGSYDLTEEQDGGSGENPFAVVRPDARAFPAVESRGVWRLELLVDRGSDCAEVRVESRKKKLVREKIIQR